MDKFNRNYQLRIASKNDGVFDMTFAPPITMEFDITKNVLTSANVCQIRLYNLSEVHRNKIRHNQSDIGHFKPIILRAGYKDNLAQIFSGNISQAWSTREGTNFVTQIECFDGGFAYNNGKCDLPPFPAGTTYKSIITAIAGTLPHVEIGSIGDYSTKITMSRSYSGNSMKILEELTNGGAFIDGGKFYALGQNEYIENRNGVSRINAKSGLLGTPILEKTLVHFDMVFEPGLNVANKIILESLTNNLLNSVLNKNQINDIDKNSRSSVNGEYIVKSIKHRGVISDAVCGDAITTGSFWFSNKPRAV